MLNNITIYKFIIKNNKLITMKYQPISCSLFDRIEFLSVMKKNVKIIYLDNEEIEKSASGIISNIFSKEGAEFLEIENNSIRLDKIKSIAEL